jgi:hypothetical protein
MGVQIDDARREHLALRVDVFARLAQILSNRRDASVGDRDTTFPGWSAKTIDDPGVFNYEIVHDISPASSVSWLAIYSPVAVVSSIGCAAFARITLLRFSAVRTRAAWPSRIRMQRIQETMRQHSRPPNCTLAMTNGSNARRSGQPGSAVRRRPAPVVVSAPLRPGRWHAVHARALARDVTDANHCERCV